MATGHQVSMTTSLASGTVAGSTSTFTYLRTIGTGTVSGGIGGTFVQGTDGYLYFQPDSPLGGSASVTSAPSFSFDDGNWGNGTVNGTSGSDTLYGGPYNWNPYSTGRDTLNGNGGDDWLFGGGGRDQLNGGAGNDYLAGGTDNDTLDGGAGDDILAGGSGSDTLNGGAGQDYADYRDSGVAVTVNLDTGTGSGGDAAGDTVAGVDGIYGSAFDDTLIGFDSFSTSGDVYTNIFYGYGGDDTIEGRGGDDQLFGGDGDDTIYGDRPAAAGSATNSDNDLIDGGAGNDTLYGGVGDDTIDGGDGDDQLLGEDGDDTLDGGAGDDWLDGGAGTDTLTGGAGDDTLAGGSGSDTLVTGYGTDTIDGGADQDRIVVADHSATPGFTIGGSISGGGTGSNYDEIDLSAWGWGRVIVTYDPGDPKAGTIQFLDAGGNPVGSMVFSEIEKVIPCFVAGSVATTERGPVPVEDLQVGDRVLTRDDGFQEILWVGTRALSAFETLANPALCPVRIEAGALGHQTPERPMLVSPQHRMLHAAARAELLFDEGEVLIPARHLVGRPGITRRPPGAVKYVHFMCRRHQIVMVDGCWSESFQPGDAVLADMPGEQAGELAVLFPELFREGSRVPYPAARPSLRRHEVAMLFAA